MVRVQGATTTSHKELHLKHTTHTHLSECWGLAVLWNRVFGELIKDFPASLYPSSSSFTIWSHQLVCRFFPELVTFTSGMYRSVRSKHIRTHTQAHAFKHTHTRLPLGEWVHSSRKLTHTHTHTHSERYQGNHCFPSTATLSGRGL